MENEFQVLKNVESNGNVTQRDIARNTGMSLGNVNILIKRLVKKGMIKIEKLTPHTIRYILTPRGLKEKAEITYRYILSTYNFINEINSKIDNLIDNYIYTEIKHTILFGSKDEIGELLKNKLNHKLVQNKHIKSLVELEKELSSINGYDPGNQTTDGQNCLILVWQPDYQEMLFDKEIKHISLLDKI